MNMDPENQRLLHGYNGSNTASAPSHDANYAYGPAMSYQQQPGYNPQYANPYQQGAPPPGWAPSNQSQGFVPPPPMPHAAPHYAEQGEAGAGIFDAKYSMQFSDRSIRNAFVRKVFALVTIMLLVVAGMCAVPFFDNNLRMTIRRSPGIYLCAYAGFLITYLVLMCCEGVRRSFPINLILTGVFTVCTGFMTMVLTSQVDLPSVFMALIITTACCGTIILFASQTKYDLTNCMGVMFILTICLMIFGIVAIISTMVWRMSIMYSIYAFFAAILFMFYLAIDVQMLMGGRNLEYSPEDHIAAAIQIFIDIWYIFIFILQLLGSSSN